MEKIFLDRERTGKDGTFGGLYRNATRIAHTCELPWKDNENQVSCIPKGVYMVVRRFSDKYKDHFHIKDVADREFILIHTGNTIKDIKGCVLVGDAFGRVDDLPAVVASKVCMARLLKDLPQSFYLQVTGVCG